MIYPVPPGVHPNTHTCGCGAGLLMPWVHDMGGHGIRCVVDASHEDYREKNTRTRFLTDEKGRKVEVDILSQQPVETTVIAIRDEETALAAVRRADGLGHFPAQTTPSPPRPPLTSMSVWSIMLLFIHIRGESTFCDHTARTK